MKKPKKRIATRTPDVKGAGPLDWTPMFQAFREAFEWALDVAKTIARDYPEEIEAVERVRAFMRKRIAGETAHIDTDDVLFTFALIIGAIERDLGPVGMLRPWFAPAMKLPSASDLWERSFPKSVTVHFATA